VAAQRLSVVLIELIVRGVAAGHWAFAFCIVAMINSMQRIAWFRVRCIVLFVWVWKSDFY